MILGRRARTSARDYWTLNADLRNLYLMVAPRYGRNIYNETFNDIIFTLLSPASCWGHSYVG